MKRLLGTVGAVVAVGVALFVGGALLPGRSPGESRMAASSADRAAIPLGEAVRGTAIGSTQRSLRASVERGGPTRAADQAAIAFGYLHRARSDANPALYDAAEEALAASFRTQPVDNFEATLGTALLAGARHDFHAQLDWGRRAVKMNRYNTQALGVVGDAYLELGLTDKALEAYQKMVDLRPDSSSFTRVSFAAQVLGDSDGAIRAAERALGFARGSAHTAAWAHWQLAELHIAAQRLRTAEAHLEKALALVPDFGPALESTAHVAAARGRRGQAIEILSSLVQDVPLPGNFSFLGELYLLQGKRAQARVAFQAADRRLDRYTAHDVRPDVDFITFWVDRDIHLRRALLAARTLYSQRRSAAVADSLAWALYGNGRLREAQRYAREAIRRSVGDAGYHYHAGVIARALGQRAAARSLLRQALRLDPSWSIIESHRARRLLAHAQRHRFTFSSHDDGAVSLTGDLVAVRPAPAVAS